METDQNVVNRLFDRLKEIFPKWRDIWQTDGELKAAKRQWTKTLVRNGCADVQMIQAGLEAARESGWARPPSPGQFVKWCIESAKQAAGIPEKEKAIVEVMRLLRMGKHNRQKAPMSPPIYQMCMFMDWHLVQYFTAERAEKAIERAYDQMVDHWRAGKPFAEKPIAIEENPSGVVHTRASREKAKKVLGDLIKELK